jgi:hypothetical protein
MDRNGSGVRLSGPPAPTFGPKTRPKSARQRRFQKTRSDRRQQRVAQPVGLDDASIERVGQAVSSGDELSGRES